MSNNFDSDELMVELNAMFFEIKCKIPFPFSGTGLKLSDMAKVNDDEFIKDFMSYYDTIDGSFEKDKYYAVRENSHGGISACLELKRDGEDYFVVVDISKQIEKNHFYTNSELRKHKIEKILNGK